MQREREFRSFDESPTVKEELNLKQIFNKKKIGQILQPLFLEHEVNIYDQFYRNQPSSEHSLFVKCPKSDDYQIWVGYCQRCGEDHETKYFKIIEKNNQSYIPIVKQHDLRVVDCDQFSRQFRDRIFPALNGFLSLLNNEEQPLEEYNRTLNYQLDNFGYLIDSIYTESRAEEIYRKIINKMDGSNKVLKSLCPQSNKLYPWHGFCSQCKSNPPHPFYVSFGGSKEPQPLPEPIKLRVVEYTNLRQAILDELKAHLWNAIQHKFYLNLLQLQSTKNDAQLIIDQRQKSLNICMTLIEEKNQYLSQLQDNQNLFKSSYEKQKRVRMILEEKKADIVFKPNKADTFYDIEIDCESILSLTAGDGWTVKMNSEEYFKKNQLNNVIVSFYGLQNKGKTFLAQQLSGKALPSGYSVQTVGLSVLYPKDLKTENGIVFLDTAGTQTPICFQQKNEIIDKHIEEMKFSDDFIRTDDPLASKEQWTKRNIYKIKLKDRLLTEELLQRFILSESNIIMIVVDQLTKEEQILVQKIKNNYENSELIIVHNLSKLVRVKDVLKYIKIDINESFEVEEQQRIFEDVNIRGNCYVEKRFDKQGKKLPYITHVFMAHQDSEAGRLYNPFCYRYLKNRILAITRSGKFDIIQNLKAMIKKALPDIVDLPADAFSKLQVELKGDKIVTNLNSSKLKSISFDILGDLKVFIGGIDPKYSIIIDQNYLILEVEIPGAFQASDRDLGLSPKKILRCKATQNSMFEWHGFRRDLNDNIQYILLRGQKPDSNVSEDFNLYNCREKGDFRLIIPINPTTCVLRDGPPELEVVNGVAVLKYKIQGVQDEHLDFF